MTIDEIVDEQMTRLRRFGVMHESELRLSLVTAATLGKQTAEPWAFEGRGPFMYLYKSGIHFHPFDVKQEDIHIEDIAWGLAHECRFGGHSPWYSVAEHSVHVSRLMNSVRAVRVTSGNKGALAGLLHDASEGYLKDIPRPLKHTPTFQLYRELEAKIQSAIYEKFLGCKTLESSLEKQVKWADRAMLATEKHELFPLGHPTNVADFGYEPPQPLRMRLPRYIQEVAYNIFMERYTNLVTDTAN